ncbi:MAG: DUF5615 family PIN-like protein [Phycicoccus sp.]
MRFLVDNNLSPRLAEAFEAAGHNAVHLRTYGMQRSPDVDVLARAGGEQRVLLSADTDFGALLAQQRTLGPSVLLVRRLTGRRVVEQAEVILANLQAVTDDLDAGAVVVLGDDRLRIRRLPIVPA